MIAIIDGKVYDTDKAELVKTYYSHRRVKGINLLKQEITKTIAREIDIYKTQKDNWFEVRKKEENLTNSTIELIPVTKEEVQQVLEDIGDVENYEKYFNELEEA